jgi:hypothetical protein
VLIYTFVEWGRAIKDETNASSGYFTVETWACAYAEETGDGSAGRLCKELQAARYLLVPVLALGSMMLVLVLRKRLVYAKEQPAVRTRSSKISQSDSLQV